jgi:hypothetical protein
MDEEPWFQAFTKTWVGEQLTLAARSLSDSGGAAAGGAAAGGSGSGSG